ncbi:GNAT family N-acetyltransferase [Microbacterium azadirachtae]|uniref:Putative ribosomal N-acetyltransferase YdaF n=1 Tax=Microbacterium azadirachtae TaxID=582680 RepID=A0A0F0LEX3_9MICO|nr:GNAT family protein [Microbacterium azadirachtae]KJL31757.1 putative ribosomal N-acetyltransferase YdaF [Microbacterium azadirachtae]
MDLGDGILLRPLLAGDGEELAAAYSRNRVHLEPWEPLRSEEFFTGPRQHQLIAESLRAVADGRGASYVLEDGAHRIVGRANLSDIVRGAFWSAHLGYWIDGRLAGRGLMRCAVDLVCALARDDLGLHRVQAATLVHNEASQRVLRATGFTEIGPAPRYLRIAGEWQDHLLFQRILEEDSPESAA